MASDNFLNRFDFDRDSYGDDDDDRNWRVGAWREREHEFGDIRSSLGLAAAAPAAAALEDPSLVAALSVTQAKADPVLLASSLAAFGPVTYYIQIDGVAGDSTDAAHKGWFEVGSFNLGESNPISFGGGGVGVASFSDLNVLLTGNAGLANLLADGASQRSLPAVTIQGVVATPSGDAVVYDLRLNDVRISSVSTSANNDFASSSVSFAYNQIGLITTELLADGSAGQQGGFGWDLATGTAIDPANLALPAPTAMYVVPTVERYFIRIDGVDGDSTDVNHKGWFEISSLQLGETIASALVPGGGGVASFQDLSVLFAGDTGLAQLLQLGASGKEIAAVEIEGVGQGAKGLETVYDLTLNGVRVTRVADSGSENGEGTAAVSFAYDRIGLVTSTITPTGVAGPSQSFAWDLLDNVAIPAAALVGGTSALSDRVPEATSFYVRIDGVAGDATAIGFKGWFEVSSLSFSETNPYSPGAGGGGAGRPDFGDLNLNFRDNSPLTALLAGVTGGNVLAAMEVRGVVTDAKGITQTVYDLVLNDVVVSSVRESASQGGPPSISASFGYAEIGLTTTGIAADGSPGTQNSFGWSEIDGAAIDPATLTLPTVGAANPAGVATTYYLKIDGLIGDSTVDGHVGWFTLPTFSIGGSNPFVPGPGGGAGRPNLQDLSVLLGDNTALADLLGNLATGTQIANIEIEGIAGTGKSSTLVYDLQLENVVVSSVSNGGSAGGGASTAVAFAYERIGVATVTAPPNGSAGTVQSTGWDVLSNTAFAYVPDAMGGNLGPAREAPEATTYFVRIDGVDGGSTAAGHEGWFEISSMSFEGALPVSFAGGGLGVGQPAFSSVELSLEHSEALAALLAANASGKSFTAVEIEGVATGADKSGQTVFDLTLNEVFVSAVSESGFPGSTFANISLDFVRFGVTTTSQNPDGTAGPQSSFAYDRALNQEIDIATLVNASSAPGDAGIAPTVFYLRIDGLVGDSTAAGREGWFEIPAFSFGQGAGFTLGPPANIGRVSFQDLFVTLAGNAALAGLLADSAAGSKLGFVELEGVAMTSKGAVTVYDLTLNDVFVTAVATGGSGGEAEPSTNATFGFGAIGLVTTVVAADGTLGAQTGFGWNLAENRAIDPATLLQGDDQTAPLVAIASQLLTVDSGAPGDLVTADGRVTLSGTASDNAGLASVQIFDGATLLGAATLAGGSWSFATTLGEGTHALTAVATDTSGNSAATSPAATIVVDLTGPALAVTAQTLAADTGASALDRITANGQVTLTGTASDLNGVTSVVIRDGAVELGTATLVGGSWTFATVLGEGAHALVAVAVDAAGNETSSGLQPQIVVDTTAPGVTLATQTLVNDTGLAGDRITTDGRVTLSGSLSDLVGVASVRIMDGTTDLGLATIVGNSWSFATTLAVGTHGLRAVATDAAGNSASTATAAQITVTTTDPIIGQPNQFTLNGTPRSDWLVVGANNIVVRGGEGADLISILGLPITGVRTLSGGPGIDTLDLSRLTRGATVDLPDGIAFGPQLGVATLTSIENVIGTGAGDIIIASRVVNVLTGGGGRDRFVFETLGDARDGSSFVSGVRDTITDFASLLSGATQRDTIDLSGIDAIRGGSDSAFTLIAEPWTGAGKQFTGAGQLRFQYVFDAQGVEHTIISGNIDSAFSGNGLLADFQIDLVGHILLSSSDFVL